MSISLPILNLTIVNCNENPQNYNKCKKLIDKVNNLLNNNSELSYLGKVNIINKNDLIDNSKILKQTTFICLTDSKLIINSNNIPFITINNSFDLKYFQNIANNSFNNINYKNDLQEKYLPIGCSILYSNLNYNIVYVPTTLSNNNSNLLYTENTNNLYYAMRAILWNITSYNYIQTIINKKNGNINNMIKHIYFPIIYNKTVNNTFSSKQLENDMYNSLKLILKAFLEHAKTKKIINFTCKKKNKYYYNYLPIDNINHINKEQPSINNLSKN